MRGRRVPSPPTRPANAEQRVSPTEQLDVKIEPEAWLDQLPDTPPLSRSENDMLQLGESPGRPVLMPVSGNSAVQPSFGGRQTANATAAARGAANCLDSDGDASLLDLDQLLKTDLGSIKRDTSVDEDLTSLSWLQDSNLLKGIQLKPAPEADSPPQPKRRPVEPEQQLPVHPVLDYVGADSELADSDDSSPPAQFSLRSYMSDYNLFYDPKREASIKPPFSFSCLIFMAIEDSTYKALPVREIYVWIQKHFPYYKLTSDGWKNSIRHNLSLNRCFKRVDKLPMKPSVDRASVRYKGSFWTVEPDYRSSLIHTLQRTAVMYPLGARPEIRSSRIGAAPAAQQRLRLRRSRDGPPHTYFDRQRQKGRPPKTLDPESATGGPDPTLFPLLAARLMRGPRRGDPPGDHPSTESPTPSPDGSETAADSRLLTPLNGNKGYYRMREGQFTDLSTNSSRQRHTEPCLKQVMMISRSAAEDHTYDFYSAALRRQYEDGDIDEDGDTDEDGDETLTDDDNTLAHELRGWPGGRGSGRSGDLTPEEVEGADLLLNLAGVTRETYPRPLDRSRRSRLRPKTGASGDSCRR